jgi:tRNA (guanine26-N2/guanine27-N2)-dimethyltransferase
MQPEGWPGHIWLEGRTSVHLRDHQLRPSHMPRGPATKTGEGFLNPAMAPARTRSVMLLADALENGWLVPEGKVVRALDALCATGVRPRRWRKEIPSQDRLRITANDLDSDALAWARESHREHPIGDNLQWAPEPSRFSRDQGGVVEDGIHWIEGDATRLMVQTPFQWIDLDPFGSPVGFLDSAIQAISRVGVLEVTATDTAALCGSAKTSAARRYGSVGINDSYMHDDATRVLLGTIARIAAMHDKSIHPILSLFDGHHVRVTVLLKRSKEEASDWRNNIGYRVRSNPYHFAPQPEGKFSGPMWIGPIFDAGIAGRITVEKAIELCAGKDEDLPDYWDEIDIEHSQREIQRSVRYISESAGLLSQDHLLVAVDDLGVAAGVGQIPSMKKIKSGLEDAGFRMARCHMPEAMFATDADWETVLNIIRSAD